MKIKREEEIKILFEVLSLLYGQIFLFLSREEILISISISDRDSFNVVHEILVFVLYLVLLTLYFSCNFIY